MKMHMEAEMDKEINIEIMSKFINEHKTNYYLCAQWDKNRHLEPLLDWIWENR